jgi:hypothetical protein
MEAHNDAYLQIDEHGGDAFEDGDIHNLID